MEEEEEEELVKLVENEAGGEILVDSGGWHLGPDGAARAAAGSDQADHEA